MTTYSFKDFCTISGSSTILGKEAASTLDFSVSTGNTIVGYRSGAGLISGGGNTIIGDNVSIASSCGNATIIGHNAVCNVTSGDSRVILIGNGASLSATHTNVCVLGGSTKNTALVTFGRGPLFFIPITTKGASATLTGAEVLSGLIVFNNGTWTCTFPSDQTIFDAMVDPVVGSGTRFLLRKNTSSALTLVTASLSDYKGPASISSGDAYYFYIVVKATSPAALYIRASKTTINA